MMKYDTINNCPRNKGMLQDGRVPGKRQVLMYGNIHCTYDCTYSRFLFTRRGYIDPEEDTTRVSR